MGGGLRARGPVRSDDATAQRVSGYQHRYTHFLFLAWQAKVVRSLISNWAHHLSPRPPIVYLALLERHRPCRIMGRRKRAAEAVSGSPSSLLLAAPPRKIAPAGISRQQQGRASVQSASRVAGNDLRGIAAAVPSVVLLWYPRTCPRTCCGGAPRSRKPRKVPTVTSETRAARCRCTKTALL